MPCTYFKKNQYFFQRLTPSLTVTATLNIELLNVVRWQCNEVINQWTNNIKFMDEF